MVKKYRCKKCGFEYRFKNGSFVNMPLTAVAEMHKCPKCEEKMEVKHGG